MGYTVETIDHDLLTIRIELDDDCVNPRKEWDNGATMACWHRSYDLGDKNPFSEPQEAEAHFKETGAMYQPLYLYDHSGITISTSPFSCPRDSGQIGYIFMTPEQIRKAFGCKRITKAIRQKAMELMTSEVSVYDDYLTGNCYGYVIEDKEGNHLDSCWGFLGNSEYCKSEAESVAAYLEKDLAVAYSI